ncbi:hypothetical protein EDB85DRAFT_1896091 [Lactarius pseudohatsudake]|nr:hypothetical protein EDB85DRAFT_1896091 [Lactarius pseudohatsudake]
MGSLWLPITRRLNKYIREYTYTTVGFCGNERGRSWDARNTASPGVPMHRRPRCLGRGAPNRLQQARQQIRSRHRGPAARPTERAETSTAIVCNVYDSEGGCVKRKLFGGIARAWQRRMLETLNAPSSFIYGLETDPVTKMGLDDDDDDRDRAICQRSHAHISGLPLVLVTAFCDESVIDAGLLPANIHTAVEPLGGETCVSDAGHGHMDLLAVSKHADPPAPQDEAPQAETKFSASVYWAACALN